MYRKVCLLLALTSVLVSCSEIDADSPIGTDSIPSEHLDLELERLLAEVDPSGLEAFILPEETDLSNIPADPRNLLTPEKVELGKLLFHETGFARIPEMSKGMNTYSCASCHHVEAGFQAGIRQGIGDGGLGFGTRGEGRKKDPDYKEDALDVQPIRTPSALNAAFQRNQLWNGQFGADGKNVGTEDKWEPDKPTRINFTGFQGVEVQAIAALGIHRITINDTLVEELGYQTLFDEVFNALPPRERYNHIAAGLAIAAYERTLLPTQAPFQRWLRGEQDAMSDQEKKGAILFFGKAGCASCHTGPALNSMEFYALGMDDLTGPNVFGVSPGDEAHLGRGGFTDRPEDMYKFKVPQLYNLVDAPFYGHGGTFTNIQDVIEYKNQAIPSNPRVPQSQLAETFEPLGLSSTEIAAIASFIEGGLYDPYLSRYAPTHVMSGKCFPNNDEKTRIELGCTD